MAQAAAERLVLRADDRRRRSTPRITSGSSTAPTRSTPSRRRRTERHRRCAAQKAPPILEFDQDGNAAAPLGRPGRPRAISGPASNHGITIDHKGNVWIGGNGRQRRHGAEVHAGRQVPDAGRQEGRAGRQQRQEHFWHGRQDLRRQEGRTRRTSPTATATSASSCIDADTGKFKRYWGAYGNKPDDKPTSARYNPDAPLAQQFRDPGALRRDVERRHRLRLRPRQRSHAGVHARRQVHQGSCRSAGVRSATARPGTSRSRRIRSRSSSISPTASNEKVRILDRQSLEILTNFGDGGKIPGPVLRRCTASPPTRRATSTRPKPTRAAACRSSSPRGSARCRARTWASSGRRRPVRLSARTHSLDHWKQRRPASSFFVLSVPARYCFPSDFLARLFRFSFLFRRVQREHRSFRFTALRIRCRSATSRRQPAHARGTPSRRSSARPRHASANRRSSTASSMNGCGRRRIPLGDFVQAEPTEGRSGIRARPTCGCCSTTRCCTSAWSASTAIRRKLSRPIRGAIRL